MHLISWFDNHSGKTQTLKVHTMRAVADVTRTLQSSSRYEEVKVTYLQPRRIREYVIVFEK
jgi:hypothetical protein